MVGTHDWRSEGLAQPKVRTACQRAFSLQKAITNRARISKTRVEFIASDTHDFSLGRLFPPGSGGLCGDNGWGEGAQASTHVKRTSAVNGTSYTQCPYFVFFVMLTRVWLGKLVDCSAGEYHGHIRERSCPHGVTTV